MLGFVWVCSDLCEGVRICAGVFGFVRLCSDLSGRVRIFALTRLLFKLRFCYLAAGFPDSQHQHRRAPATVISSLVRGGHSAADRAHERLGITPAGDREDKAGVASE